MLVLSRADFRALVDHLPVLDAYFSKLLDERQADAAPRARAEVP